MKEILTSGRTWRYVIVGLAAYLLFLVLFFPATWLAWGAAHFSRGAVHLAAPSGTLWYGSGELRVQGPLGAQSLGDLRWTVNPLWLLLGRLNLSLHGVGGPDGEARLQLARHRIQVDDLQATLPVQIAGLVYAPAGFFAPTGRLQLKASHLELDAGGLRGNAEVLWRGAGGRFTGDSSLGDYRIELDGRGETAAIKLDTVSGKLELAGTGQWRVTGDGEIRFNGHAVPRSDASQLEPLLAAMGRDQGGGRRAITFVARVPLVKLLNYRQ